MTYDLAIFDPEMTPREPAEFDQFYEAQTNWLEPHSYSNSTVCTKAMRNWYLDMIKYFPPLSIVGDPAAVSDDEGIRNSIADYAIGKSIIYAAFQWPKQEAAYETCFRLAKKHGVVFFDVSADNGAVYFPTGDGELVMLFHING